MILNYNFKGNIVEMAFQSYKTNFVETLKNVSNATNGTSNQSTISFKVIEAYILIILYIKLVSDYSSTSGTSNGTNFLGLLSFCILFGNVIGHMDDRGRELLNIFESLSKAFFGIIRFIIW